MAEDWARGTVVGAGSFGTVSLAMNRASGELFAVKSIECVEAASRELEALENEARILENLDSPWIVRFLGCGFSEEKGVRMKNLFLEYMAGGSVADIVKKFGGSLDESVIRTYTRGILEGIHYLHGQGIVHCDIKGKNVLLGGGGFSASSSSSSCGVVIKLADFGSAKMMQNEEDGETQPVFVGMRGTPLWMAPEVVRQEAQGPASDIWSLGCTVFEMATGCPPWSHLNHPMVAMLKIGCSDELPEFPRNLSMECLDFLDKCFRRIPQERWSSEQLLQHPFITGQQIHGSGEQSQAHFSTVNLDLQLQDCSGDEEDSTQSGSAALEEAVEVCSSSACSGDGDGESLCRGKGPASAGSNEERRFLHGVDPFHGQWITVRSRFTDGPPGSLPFLTPSWAQEQAPGLEQATEIQVADEDAGGEKAITMSNISSDSSDETSCSVSSDFSDETICSVSSDFSNEARCSISSDFKDGALCSVASDFGDEICCSISSDFSDGTICSVPSDSGDETHCSISSDFGDETMCSVSTASRDGQFQSVVGLEPMVCSGNSLPQVFSSGALMSARIMGSRQNLDLMRHKLLDQLLPIVPNLDKSSCDTAGLRRFRCTSNNNYNADDGGSPAVREDEETPLVTNPTPKFCRLMHPEPDFGTYSKAKQWPCPCSCSVSNISAAQYFLDEASEFRNEIRANLGCSGLLAESLAMAVFAAAAAAVLKSDFILPCSWLRTFFEFQWNPESSHHHFQSSFQFTGWLAGIWNH